MKGQGRGRKGRKGRREENEGANGGELEGKGEREGGYFNRKSVAVCLLCSLLGVRNKG